MTVGISDELQLRFQPVVRLADRATVGAESFLWRQHSARGLLSPGEWIPEAERNGEIVAWATASVDLLARVVGDVEDIVVSLNVGSRQLLDDGFLAAMTAVAPSTACRLAVEVPHLQFFPEQANELAPVWGWLEIPDLDDRLGLLRAQGFQIWIDDFGDGLMDESPTRADCVDVVKLDRSLLQRSEPWLHDLHERIVASGARTLIEGIEHEGHLVHARRAGIELGQGFLFGLPAPTLPE